MIDVTWLAGQVAAILAPSVPILLGKVAETATQEIHKDTLELGKSLWARLRPAVESKPAAREAVEDVAEDPANEDAHAALRQQLRKLLAENPELQRQLASIVSNAEGSQPAVRVEASGTRSVAIGGNNTGSIATGDQDARSGRS